MNFTINRGVTAMELMEVITSKENLNRAYKKVVNMEIVSNKRIFTK